MSMMISNATNLLVAAALTIAVAIPVRADQTSAPPPTQFLKLPEGQIAYDDSGGTGPLVICAPGLGDMRQQYRFLAPRLVAAGFRVVTMGLPGHGESSVDWPAYSPALAVADIVAMVHHLRAGKEFIAGNSMA